MDNNISDLKWFFIYKRSSDVIKKLKFILEQYEYFGVFYSEDEKFIKGKSNFHCLTVGMVNNLANKYKIISKVLYIENNQISEIAFDEYIKNKADIKNQDFIEFIREQVVKGEILIKFEFTHKVGKIFGKSHNQTDTFCYVPINVDPEKLKAYRQKYEMYTNQTFIWWR